MRRLVMKTVCLLMFASSAYAEVTTEVICTYAPSQSEAVNQISTMVRGASTGTQLMLIANGMKIVAHSSGGPILRAAGGYIAGTMSGALVATTVVTIGVIATGATVTVELACAPRNHPELVKKIVDGASEYKSVSKGKLDELSEVVSNFQTVTKDKFYELMGETWFERMKRKMKSTVGMS